jgi:hypothetical protein
LMISLVHFCHPVLVAPRERATAQARSSSSLRHRWQIASTMAFLEGKKRYTLAGDILSSASMVKRAA